MVWPFRRQNSRPPPNDLLDLNSPLVWFGPGDPLTLAQAYEGVMAFGATGSGKSSGAQFLLLTSMMRRGFCGLILTVKPGEAERIQRMMELVGRGDDLIVFGDPSVHRFGFLDYQLKRLGQSSGMTENIVNLMEEVQVVVSRASGLNNVRGDEQYWLFSRRELLRNVLDLLILAVGTIEIRHIVEVIRDAPRSMAEVNDPEWPKRSCLPGLLKMAEHRVGDGILAQDLSQVRGYFLRQFPALSDKTRSVVESSLLAMLDLFLRGRLFQLFGRDSTITPEDVIRGGKVLVIDMPVKRELSVGLIGQTLWKLLFLQTLEADTNPNRPPAFYVVDEFQHFCTATDQRFAATARSSRCVNLWLTQTLPALAAMAGGDGESKAVAESVAGLCNTKIFHLNSCHETNEYASNLIGRRKLRLRNMSSQQQERRPFELFNEPASFSNGRSEQFEYLVQPHEFSRLLKGGGKELLTEAIVFQAGRRWSSTGDTWMRTLIPQGF